MRKLTTLSRYNLDFEDLLNQTLSAYPIASLRESQDAGKENSEDSQLHDETVVEELLPGRNRERIAYTSQSPDARWRCSNSQDLPADDR